MLHDAGPVGPLKLEGSMKKQLLPKYQQLPEIETGGDHHAWGIFGKADQLGTINHLTMGHVREASTLVKRGAVFNLSLPLNLPNPPFSKERGTYRHTVTHTNRNSRDDKLDDLYLQASSLVSIL